MDQLTAIRTFAKPGFTPAKHVRIFADRYYRVTFQNVETDPRCDYVGLAEGEHVLLLTGTKTREARDARLNHCNQITEWTGPVFAVLTSRYGHWDTTRKPEYAGSLNDANAIWQAAQAEHSKWIADCERELAHHTECQNMKPEEWRASAIRDCKRTIETQRDTFRFEILRVR